MSDIHRAVALAAGANAGELEQAYWSAIAEGALNTRSAPERERALGALRLLTLALLRLPDLALPAYLLDVAECGHDDGLDLAWETACDTGAGALRLAHRALEAHAEALGYCPHAWVAHALERARAALAELEPALLEGSAALAQEQLRRTAIALARAAAATAEDGMRVPGEIATGLAHLLALFMITTGAIGT